MNISLIGMSGIGKSHWAKKLSDHLGYPLHCCDELIEERLGPQIGGQGIAAVSSWMGQPFEHQYQENSSLYLRHEADVTEAAIMRIKSGGAGLIIDTTGSVIYLSEPILFELKANSKVVLLDISEHALQQLRQNYFDDPKPVIWGSAFNMQPTESPSAALRRCYPELLSSRQEKYRALADIVIPYEAHRATHMSAAALLSLIDK